MLQKSRHNRKCFKQAFENQKHFQGHSMRATVITIGAETSRLSTSITVAQKIKKKKKKKKGYITVGLVQDISK